MKSLALAAAALALSACGQSVPVDYCKGADIRRAGYQLTIDAPAVLTASGQIVPPAVILAAESARVLLDLLNSRCPVRPM